MANDFGRPENLNDAVEAMGYNIGQTPHEFLGDDGDKSLTYANLVMHGDLDKPSEAVLTAKLAEIQAEWDEDHAPWKLARQKDFASIYDQLDDLGKDLRDGGTRFMDHREKVKRDNPKNN